MEPTLFSFSYVLGRDHRAHQAHIDAHLAEDIGLALPGRLLPARATRTSSNDIRGLLHVLRRVFRPVGPIVQTKVAILRRPLQE